MLPSAASSIAPATTLAVTPVCAKSTLADYSVHLIVGDNKIIERSRQEMMSP
jgi:hypothetical protein